MNCFESERVNSLKVKARRLDFHVRINGSALWRNFSDRIGRAGFLVLILGELLEYHVVRLGISVATT
jgi:hypothetical protein